jgi:Cu+-exporting ATPase
MHREYRPEDLHHLDHGLGSTSAALGLDARERALLAFTVLLGLLIGGDLLLAGLGWQRLPGRISLALVAGVVGAVYIVYGALRALLERRIGAEIALAQASLAALILGQPFVAAEVVFIALLGEVLEGWTFARARRAMGRLAEQTPHTARVRREGVELDIPVHEVVVGDMVVVRAGEKIPVDGQVVGGRSTVDQAPLTGESLPVDKGPGDAVFTGTINQFGMIDVRAERTGGNSTFGQVLKLVAAARRRKGHAEKLADTLARYFLPVVELVALATLVGGYLLGWPDVWTRVVAVLVVACPCGLVLATPAAMLASMAWLARHGVVIKGGAAVEKLAACDTFAFDKTGTLTKGSPELTTAMPLGRTGEPGVFLALAAAAEAAADHPLARAVSREANRRSLVIPEAADATLLPGAGVRARCRAGAGDAWHEVLVGNRRLLSESAINIGPEIDSALAELDARGETALLVAVDGAVAGVIGLRDAVRPEAHDVLHELNDLKIKEIAILTGDRAPAAHAVAQRVGAEIVLAELLPADKAHWIAERRRAGRRVAMVGDGINDAPALAEADVGIALGGKGADLAAEAGDMIVLGDPLRVLPDLVRLSRKTVAIIRQNIIGFAFGLNAVAMLAATFGILGPVAAAILHQIGSLLVLLNSMRLLVFGDWWQLPPLRRVRGLWGAIERLDDQIDMERAGVWIRDRARVIAASLGVLVVVGYAISGWTVIGPDETGLLQRFGRFERTLEPGLHMRWPAPIERVSTFNRDRVRSLEIGFSNSVGDAGISSRWESTHGRPARAEADEKALLLTGDGRYVELSATLQYTIDATDSQALERFIFTVADGEGALRPIAEAAVRDVIGRFPLLELLSTGRREAEAGAVELLARRLAAYRFGIAVRAVAFQDLHPPLEVVDAYRDVSRAANDKKRRLNEAAAHKEKVLAESAGMARATLNAAEADKAAKIAFARSSADTFGALREARRYAVSLTDLRLYWTEIARALESRPKVVIDDRADGRRHLILPPLSPATALPFGAPEQLEKVSERDADRALSTPPASRPTSEKGRP